MSHDYLNMEVQKLEDLCLKINALSVWGGEGFRFEKLVYKTDNGGEKYILVDHLDENEKKLWYFDYDFSKDDVNKHIGVNIDVINNWNNGKRMNFFRYCTYMDITVLGKFSKTDIRVVDRYDNSLRKCKFTKVDGRSVYVLERKTLDSRGGFIVEAFFFDKNFTKNDIKAFLVDFDKSGTSKSSTKSETIEGVKI